VPQAQEADLHRNSIERALPWTMTCLTGFLLLRNTAFLSFPGSSLGTHILEALLRRVIAAEKQSFLQADKGSRASRTGVPKLELGNEA
jgi:hypothetical protein